MSFRLRYIPGTRDGERFRTVRYPWTSAPPCVTRERAEVLRQAMPDPTKFEIVEED
jgi:hypothetical protein